MNAPTDTEQPGQPGQPGPGREPGDHGPRVTRDEVRDLARLRRSRDDRKVAGVAAGIARHLDIDPLLVRVAFVVLTFFGGGGLILYAVCWLFVPEEGTEDTVVRVDEGIRTAALIIGGVVAIASVIGDTVGGPGFPWPPLAIGLLLIVVLAGKNAVRPGGPPHPWLRGTPVGPPPPPAPEPGAPGPTYSAYRTPAPAYRRPVDPRKRGPLLFPFTLGLAALGLGTLATLDLAGVDITPSAYPATVLGVTGLMLLVGAFYGRAGGLILVGLLAAGTTAITSVADSVEVGQERPVLQQASDLKSSYDLGVGELRIDLTDIRDLENLDGRTLDLEVGVGHILVIVPEDGLNVEARGTIDAGEVAMFGKTTSDDFRGDNGTVAGDPTLTIDADLDLGQIEFRSAA
ncbi:PspC domain-containing protein [Nocardioides kongjuensis]|uniref:Phage shock protein PspC (Stress-responsive transcriptional regulator) n=1 Tax=Nocardioides kongjuensis TaxID=349522 RepID=A0A852RSW0_9ACTN|nr:PspC domain-containing protein [Nocardioides kongjuensis]NYD33608.1 phage shock protein PspC (stress-responsive transcriptional regulator) [Nocardioides kongjuensis]